MVKIRTDVHYPWGDYWVVSFDHSPYVYRGENTSHIVHCFQHLDGSYWPEMVWFWNFQDETIARLFLDLVLHDPLILADICYMCNVSKGWLIRTPRFNIHRGQNRLWIPPDTHWEPWYSD
jgi:hypothetical protein